MKRHPERPVLITDAATSQEDQLRRRQIRYVTMMSVRAGCLILGAILISARAPLLPLWLALCALGMVLLPWMAVLIANDRPPKTKAERAADAAAREDTRRALTQPAPEPDHITIDAEVVDEARGRPD
ncbi:hypothetical protein GCM10010112_01400 [Actinoplanes lobatus]|uniref:DUF3099 domain-containing protein n=1 Tax=Actinoplanes lobatus TaxID=113568 RepID=A0A7W7H9U2_9ACTN|nr:DUF3099 domain-containing protein [Actinoplanes lobatus]MBB4746561.1 hypothetical protein [Actinoplanes lobatus]GGN53011.1 hypothetical protein GCM10010112_01400 [Actinoplanes lobatus]GIE38629.1 hypothetical protein Alo02nite_15270 [Actinoplanes lobatus]